MKNLATLTVFHTSPWW